MLASDLDLSDVSFETVNAVAAANGLTPPGKYHARLEGSADRHNPNTGSTGIELEFAILAPAAFAGAKVKDTVWFPSEGDDPDRAAKAKNRYCLVGHRLGLLKPAPGGKGFVPADPNKQTFGDLLGVECVIEVAHRKYKRKDDGSEATAVNVTFGGYFRLDDKEAKGVPQAKGAKPAAPAPSQAGKPKQMAVADL